MIIDIVHVHCAAINETKRHSPVGSHRYGPNSLLVALKRMKPKTREVHIFDCGRGIETDENVI